MTYATEAERQKTEDMFVEICGRIWPGSNPDWYRMRFSEEFPPLVPTKEEVVREYGLRFIDLATGSRSGVDGFTDLLREFATKFGEAK